MPKKFGWYLDITTDLFYLGDHPTGKRGVSLCKRHGRCLEKKEMVVPDHEADQLYPAEYCWICGAPEPERN